LESYLVEIGRSEHRPISPEIAYLLRGYGKNGVMALRMRGLTEEEIASLPKPELASAARGEGDYDDIICSQADYARANGLEPNYPRLLERAHRQGIISEPIRVNHGRYRFHALDRKSHEELKARLAALQAEHKENRKRGQEKRKPKP
jgi:hypothetical protein